MSRFSFQLLSRAVIVALAAATVVALSSRIESIKPKLPDSYADSELVFQGKRLKGFALGAEGLIADWYWIMSLQYIGDKIVRADASELNIDDLSNLNPRLLYPYLDNATDLDPKFFAAYSYGASVLPAIDADQAIALTEKGIRNNPDRWRLYQYLGYIYWRTNRFQKAAEAYDKGSRIEGAPPFMKQMAAAMLTKGGSREVARSMYVQMLNESEDQQSKQSASLRLARLDSLDQLDIINTALDSLRSKRGSCPKTLSDVIPILREAKTPARIEFRIDAANNFVDPLGTPYVLNYETCKADIDFTRSRLPAQ